VGANVNVFVGCIWMMLLTNEVAFFFSLHSLAANSLSENKAKQPTNQPFESEIAAIRMADSDLVIGVSFYLY
jgi:hypothetical protein